MAGKKLWGDLVGDAMTKLGNTVQQSVTGKDVRGYSKAIGNFTGAPEAIGRLVRDNDGFAEAINKTFAKNGSEFGTKGYKADWNKGKIAGSFIGAAAVGRVATGGGVYKDGQGNTNLVGVPFV